MAASLIGTARAQEVCDTTFAPPAAKARLGEVHYSPRFGGTVGQEGRFFEMPFLTEEATLVHFRVNLSTETSLIHALEAVVETPDGRQTVRCGQPDGVWQTFDVPEGAAWIGLSGAGGWLVDHLRFHFSDGTMSPRYGGSGGDTAVQLLLNPRPDGTSKSDPIGLWGSFHDGYLETIGLVFMPVE